MKSGLLKQIWGKAIPERSHDLGESLIYQSEDLKGQCDLDTGNQWGVSAR